MIVLFDAKLRTRSGKVLPFYEQAYVEDKKDGDLVWFHECYGWFHLYKLEFVEDDTFIAVDMRRSIRNIYEDFERFLRNPHAAIVEGHDSPQSIRFVR